MAIIKADNLSYSYNIGKVSVPVLKNVSLEIEAGEIVAIQGPSGSGKSTLLHVLGCLSQSQSGKLDIDGIDVSLLSKEQLAFIRNRKLGFIFQQFHLLPRTTILDNILLPTLYPLEIASVTSEDKNRAVEYARRLGLEHRLDHYPNELSGGEQQRVAIARALIRNSGILLADEPTGNLDSKRANQILKILKDFNREKNLTIILVTHEADIAKEAHRTIHLHDGEIRSIEINEKRNVLEQKIIEPEITETKHTIHGIFKTIFKLIPLATKNIFRNKTRSILTMLGIIIGISSILIMVTLGKFTERKILASYDTLGVNALTIRGQPNWFLKASDTFPVKFESFSMKDDIEPLKEIFPQISMVSPLLWSMIEQISYAGKSISISDPPLLGVGKDFFRITDAKMLMGRDFNSYHMSNADSVCIIGYGIYQRLFKNIDPIDKVVYISGRENSFSCTVIGTLEKNKTNKKRSGDQDLVIFVPYTFIKNISDNPWENKIQTFYLKIKNTKDVARVGYAIENYFKSKYGKSGTFKVSTYALLIAQMKRFLTLFNLMLAAISLIALVVGGIGIANMMLVSLSERFKEIGIRKAVGATDFSMRIQFLLESTIICCLAGIIGLIGGFIIYEGIIYMASKFVKDLNFEVVISPIALILAILSMLTVGIISGLVPALKAEALEITTALRSE